MCPVRGRWKAPSIVRVVTTEERGWSDVRKGP